MVDSLQYTGSLGMFSGPWKYLLLGQQLWHAFAQEQVAVL